MTTINNKTQEYSTIYKTTDYDKFSFIGGNRELRVNNIEKMRQSMIEKQLVIPILVNEKFQIIDGQHRFTVCRQLEKPVYYYIEEGYDLSDVERANRSNTNWSLNDFLSSFVHKGNENYKNVELICNTYNVLASDVLKIIAKIRKVTTLQVTIDFKDEKLEFDGEMFDKVIAFYDALTLFEEFSLYNKSKFISAYMELYFNPRYNHQHMIEKYRKLSDRLKHCPTKDDYLVMLCNDIYSGKRVSPNNIYYDANRKQFY